MGVLALVPGLVNPVIAQHFNSYFSIPKRPLPMINCRSFMMDMMEMD